MSSTATAFSEAAANASFPPKAMYRSEFSKQQIADAVGAVATLVVAEREIQAHQRGIDDVTHCT